MITNPLLKEADRCVKCGLCLPRCPTYLKLANEADSPRGRISLIQAMITREIDLTGSLQRHINQCLGCRACEKACPSGVSYGRLLDGARHEIRKSSKGRATILKPWLLKILSDRKQLKNLSRPLPILRRSHLLHLGKMLLPAKLKQAISVAEVLPDRVAQPGLFPANSPSGVSVQLFLGCVSSLADQPVISAAIQLLTRLGYAVDVPQKQVCCGALHRHNGFPEEADRLCQHNSRLFKTSRAKALITLATGCHLELIEQNVSGIPIQTITEFILNHLDNLSFSVEFAPLPAKTAVHTPCTSKYDCTSHLLSAIPDLEIFELPCNDICCGAAGSYLLTQPTLANEFGQDKIAHLQATKPDILVTTNSGCAIQFRMQIRQARLRIQVLHPIELINRQFKDPGFRA